MDTNGNTILCEDYVSYEVAKLLKDKGFDEPCRYIYDTFYENLHLTEMYDNVTNYDLDLRDYVCYLAPTLQMACKWLRDKYSIFIEINLVFMPNTHYNVCALDFKDLHNIQWYDDVPSCTIYEEAVEAALKYTLENLI